MFFSQLSFGFAVAYCHWICCCIWCSMTSKSAHSKPDIHTFHMMWWRWSQLLVYSKFNLKQLRIFSVSTENAVRSLVLLLLCLYLTEQMNPPHPSSSSVSASVSSSQESCQKFTAVLTSFSHHFNTAMKIYHCHNNNNINP